MADPGDTADRLRTLRQLHGRLTQQQLADAAGVSKSIVSKVESGERDLSWPIACRIATAMRVDPVTLLGHAAGPDTTGERTAAAIPEIRRALAAYDDPETPRPGDRPLPTIAAEVEQLSRLRLGAGYVHLGERVPYVIGELGRAANALSGVDRQRAYWLLAAAYRCADACAFKGGHHDLSALAVERILWAAGRSGDPLMGATASYVRGQTYLVAEAYEPGLRALSAAAEPLSRRAGTDRRAAAVYGALHMRAAVIAARGRMADVAWSHMRIASAMADTIGRDVEYYYTSFGPSNARIHEIAVAVELGDDREALRRAAGWQPGPDVPAERASHHLIDLACAQLWAGDHNAATESLLAARARAPQHTRTHPRVRSSVLEILRRSRRRSDEITGLATWLGIA